MPTWKEAYRPIIVIIIASAIIMFLLAPLDATEWASGFRVGGGGEGREEGLPSGAISIIGPLIKITILMGVPGLITVGVRRLIGRLRKK